VSLAHIGPSRSSDGTSISASDRCSESRCWRWDVAPDTALNLLYWNQVAVVLIANLVVLTLAEILVTLFRVRIR
jgi:hypothetical protein